MALLSHSVNQQWNHFPSGHLGTRQQKVVPEPGLKVRYPGFRSSTVHPLPPRHTVRPPVQKPRWEALPPERRTCLSRARVSHLSQESSASKTVDEIPCPPNSKVALTLWLCGTTSLLHSCSSPPPGNPSVGCVEDIQADSPAGGARRGTFWRGELLLEVGLLRREPRPPGRNLGLGGDPEEERGQVMTHPAVLQVAESWWQKGRPFSSPALGCTVTACGPRGAHV